MKAVLNRDLDKENQTSESGRHIFEFLESGTPVNLIKAEYRKGNQFWYKLSDDDTWVASEAVDVDYMSGLPDEDKNQMFICYRSLDTDNKPNIKDIAPPPNELFFQVLPATANSNTRVAVNRLGSEILASTIAGWTESMATSRKHVFVYIHGFDWEPSLKLDLPYLFMHGYFRHPENSIAKVLYFGWPSMGWRKRSDDRSIEAGENFTQNRLFKYFEDLSARLKEQNRTLNLIVHSFGLQLLNGMVNPGDTHTDKLPGKIFNRIFLMAPDITHLAIQKGGVQLKNMVRIRKGRQYIYNLKPLKNIAKKVYIYHNSGDYLLYVSTKKFNGKSKNFIFNAQPDACGITTDYRTLGNVGKGLYKLEGPMLEPDFDVVDVQELIEKAKGDIIEPLFYPFKNNEDFADMKTETEAGNYGRFDMLETFWQRQFFMTHHQYMFTCKPVVDDVLRRMLDEDELAPENPNLIV